MPSKLNTFLHTFPLEAGTIALALRGKVKNKPKRFASLGIRLRKDRTARTIADEIIQELFLSRVRREFPHMAVNAEEATQTRRLLARERMPHEKKSVLHIDPIDGTYSYLAGKKEFATGIARSGPSGNFTHSAIYFPALDRLCLASPHSCGVFDRRGRKRIFPGRVDQRLVFAKRIFSDAGAKAMAQRGFRVIPPPSTHYAIVMVALGKAAAFLYGTSNPHDSMIPYAFAAQYGIGAETLGGKKIKGSMLKPEVRGRTVRYARIPSVCYFSCDTAKKNIIRAVLKNKKNLDREYLLRGAPHE